MYSKQRCEEGGLLKVPQKRDPNCTRCSEQLSGKGAEKLCNAARSSGIEKSHKYRFCRRCNSILYEIVTLLYDLHHICSKDTDYYRTI